MILSIGMIVKNEEKYLERCLTALKPILDALDSELIIADTGSTDRTVEIAKKFTNNVFHFEWVNDFSAARNSTLEKAQGEWYMFIDADEIVVDCNDIIRFFKSGEYKKFKSAAYIQRSYLNESEQNECVDFRVMRAVKREKDTRFVNPIHEYLSPFYYPTKYLDFVVMHYGYMYINNNGTTNLALEKSKRNLELLLNELNSYGICEKHLGIYNQIADGYEIAGDLENALKYLDMGLENIDHHSINIVPYYSHKIQILVKLDDFDKIIEVSNEYFDKSKNPFHTKDLATDCYIRAMSGYSYYRCHDYGKSISELSQFINLYGKYCKGKLNTEDLLMEVWRTTDTIVKSCYEIFFRCCYREKQFALANEYTKIIPLEKYLGDQSFMITHLNIRVEMMENVGYNKLDELYRQLDDFGKNHLLAQIRRRIVKTNPKNREVIIKKLSSLGGICAELSKIYTEYFINNNADIENISEFLEKYGSENGEDLLYILLEKQADITPFLMTSDFFADRAVQLLMLNFPGSEDLFENYDVGVISSDGLQRAASLYGWVMLRFLDNKRGVSKAFEMYGKLGVLWSDKFGNKTAIPGDIRAALLVNDVVCAAKSGSKVKLDAAVRKLTAIVADLKPLVAAYEEENKRALKAAANPEFARLAAQVKRNIRDMTTAGDHTNAWSLLAELEALCPDDPDIEQLKNAITDVV